MYIAGIEYSASAFRAQKSEDICSYGWEYIIYIYNASVYKLPIKMTFYIVEAPHAQQTLILIMMLNTILYSMRSIVAINAEICKSRGVAHWTRNCCLPLHRAKCSIDAGRRTRNYAL